MVNKKRIIEENFTIKDQDITQFEIEEPTNRGFNTLGLILFYSGFMICSSIGGLASGDIPNPYGARLSFALKVIYCGIAYLVWLFIKRFDWYERVGQRLRLSGRLQDAAGIFMIVAGLIAIPVAIYFVIFK